MFSGIPQAFKFFAVNKLHWSIVAEEWLSNYYNTGQFKSVTLYSFKKWVEWELLFLWVYSKNSQI
jgi:hypothetical protein